jgi:hypothetical protein
MGDHGLARGGNEARSLMAKGRDIAASFATFQARTFFVHLIEASGSSFNPLELSGRA